jgi:hypothetical protein
MQAICLVRGMARKNARTLARKCVALAVTVNGPRPVIRTV